ncbi:MAG: IS3 family transposase [Pseudonocardiaceae bacterium]
MRVGRGVHIRLLQMAGPARLGHGDPPCAPQKLVTAVFGYSDGTYGYRRIHAQLSRQGEPVSPELVRELMRELDLVACQPTIRDRHLKGICDATPDASTD